MSAAISYTGGKDCTLALHRIVEQGIKVAVLVTFSPPSVDPKSFKAHAIDIVYKQAEALGIPHTICVIDGPDYVASYQREIKQLATDFGVNMLVTGDSVPVCSNFMERAVQNTGVELVQPLWGQPREELMKEMWKREFDILITCINLEKIPTEILEQVKEVYGVGKRLTQVGLNAINQQEMTASATGELGELHSMVLDCPLYKNQKIIISSDIVKEEMFLFLKIKSVELVNK